MAVSVSRPTGSAARADDVWGRHEVHLFEVTFDSSYPTGGEALDFGPYGVKDSANARYFFQQRAPLTGSYNFVYDRSNEKLLVFVEEAVAAGGPLVEAGNTTDLSALIVDVLVIEA